VELSVMVVSRGGEHPAVCSNLGLGGMRIATQMQVSYGDSVVVLVDATGAPELGLAATALCLPAIVRWRDSVGIGVQFGLLGVGETRGLISLIKRFSNGANRTPVDPISHKHTGERGLLRPASSAS
jgi:hypothetical protein